MISVNFLDESPFYHKEYIFNTVLKTEMVEIMKSQFRSPVTISTFFSGTGVLTVLGRDYKFTYNEYVQEMYLQEES
ncbi:hypothetical protein NVP1121O_104 [Vibrio phage 1.121.O._10N.286.46.C4]|nr:hypothetical protein NVP1121O_104 [Vibrio phage 1.121.O._10N.286.46.C4]